MIRVRAAFAAVVLLIASGGTAWAQQTERDDRRIDRMERTVRQLEGIIRQGAATGRPVTVAPETLPTDVAQLRTRLDDLEAAHRSLISTVEALTNELNGARRTATEAQAQVRELQTRVAVAESRLAEPPPPPPPAIDPAAAVAGTPPATAARRPAEGSLGAVSAPGDPAVAFQRARQQLLEGDYASASRGFEAFATAYPSDPRAAEARYWLGETLYIREDYGAAAQAYIAALRGWPATSWAPDALVKLSGSLVELKQTERACQTLGEFTRRYASSSASVKARAAGVRTRAKCAA
jgi:tol-pal system protein YbgF